MLFHLRGLGSKGWSVSDCMVKAELSGSQFPYVWESGGAVTLATKASAVRYWLLREEREHSAQKPRTYKSSVYLSPQRQKFSRSQRMENSGVPSGGHCIPLSRSY